MRRALFLIFLVVAFSHAGKRVTYAISQEAQLKAAYLYNFTKFIQWPESTFARADSPIVIGVVGDRDFFDALRPLEEKQIFGRSIRVRHYQALETPDCCHLLYINSNASVFREVLAKIGSKPIVTVGETDDFAQRGGTIQLLPKRGRLRFIINLTAATNRGIKIDAQLLSLATEVLKEGQE